MFLRSKKKQSVVRPVCGVLAVLGMLLFWFAATTNAAPKSKPRKNHPSFVQVEDMPGLARVLLIGDSISMQYTLPVRKLLEGKANVHRPARNCRSTRQTLEELDEYLGEGRWGVIHFNWGIHDLTHLNQEGKAVPPPEGKHQVPLEEYKRSVRTLVQRLKQTGARLIWASTTPIGSRAESKGFRRDVDVMAYNAAAAEVMRAEGVIVNDLYSLVKPRAEKLLSDGVHFTANGSTVLAGAVAGAIQKALEDPREEEATMPKQSAVPKGLTIPIIDISDETGRHVIVAAGTKTDYRGQVNTVLMADGKTMFAVWSIGHGGMCGPLKKSEDRGLTWSELLPTPENWGSVGSCPCIFRLTDQKGTQRLFVFAGRPKHYQSMSLDGGQTWTPMEWTGMYKPGGNTVVVPIDGGRRHLLLVQRGPQPDLASSRSPITVWQAVSSDGGLTWKDYRQVCAVAGADPCEPDLIRSPDGRQLLCLMRENRRRFNSLMMLSDDEGRTWSDARELPASLTGDRHMFCYAPDGRLVVVFRERALDSPTYGHFVAWVGTYDDICRGQPGQYRIKLLHSYAGADCGYSGLECLADGTFVATTYVKYRPGPKKHSIVSVRFKLEEIDTKARRLEGATGRSSND